MYAHIDGNNFYCSCERLFQPSLRAPQGMVVLSNNDGCIIARSQEVKALGIPMAAPLFKYRHLIQRHNIQLRSPNFALYGEMSTRMMNTIATLAPAIEVYSIDEAFIDLRALSLTTSAALIQWAEHLRGRVAHWVGIPTAVGMGPTKTLAKLANHIAKTTGTTTALVTPDDIRAALSATPLGEIWGIGRKTLEKLRTAGIHTLPGFVAANPNLIDRRLGAPGMRLWSELNGTPTLVLEEYTSRKSISFSRTFPDPIADYQQLEQIIASFVSICARKLRRNRQTAAILHVFGASDPYRGELPQQSGSTAAPLPVPTNDTAPLLAASRGLLRHIWSPAIAYKRAGILLSSLAPDTARQPLLFGAPGGESGGGADKTPARDTRPLYSAVDAINARHGTHTVRLGAEGIDISNASAGVGASGWAPKRQHLGSMPAGDFCHLTVGTGG